jgi:hypothetical protein
LLLNGKTSSYSGLEILRILLDVLTSFSSLPVPNVRDTVTEAILSISSVLIEKAIQTKGNISMLERQRSGVDDARDNTKSKAIEKQIQTARKVIIDKLRKCSL